MIASAATHDDPRFPGFPEPLYELRAMTRPAHLTSRASEVAALLASSGTRAGVERLPRPDHGAWVPLR